jgi:hypothetical protein
MERARRAMSRASRAESAGASSVERARRAGRSRRAGIVGGAGSAQEQGGRRRRAGWAELRRDSGRRRSGRGRGRAQVGAGRGRTGRRESDRANASGRVGCFLRARKFSISAGYSFFGNHSPSFLLTKHSENGTEPLYSTKLLNQMSPKLPLCFSPSESKQHAVPYKSLHLVNLLKKEVPSM